MSDIGLPSIWPAGNERINMKRLVHYLLLSLTFLSVSEAGAAIYVDSQVVCQVRPGANADTVASVVGAFVEGEIEPVSTYLMSYRLPVPVDSIISLLEKHPDVLHVQPNFIVRINLDQVSQAFVDQTSQAFVDGVAPEPYYDHYADNNMMIDSSHLIHDGTGQVIAIIDGGLDNRHPLFGGRLHAACYDFIGIDNEPWGYDGITANHGTFVAGIAARAARNAELMIIRAFTNAGTGNSFEIAHSICYAAENGADVINMSFGMDHNDGTITYAINYAYAVYGVVMAAAAGNSNLETDRFPGNHPYVMNIAAVDENDIKADFSNFGVSVSATACGVEIYSSLCGGDVWGWWCGTSFATPFVSGLAAIVRSVYPQAEPEFIIERIQATSDNIDDLNPLYGLFLGAGRVNFIHAAYLEGDANGNGSVNVGDIVFLVNYVFGGGPLPVPPEAGDANCDGEVNVGDAVFIVNYVFNEGDAPGCD
jgi:subtilisin family serine protease